MRFNHLEDWLGWQESLHATTIDLGLTRCRRVLGAMGLADVPFRVITVGGTNGKGSCAAILEKMLLELGQHTGVCTSPHLSRYNERIRIGGREASDQQIMSAFDAIDRARGETSLTYFEFATVAAVCLFSRADVETAVMEVGLGGRLDASNSIDADVAIITSLSLDHQNWLGNTLSEIAREKAGIVRAGRPAVCGEPDPPESLFQAVIETGAHLRRRGKDFFVSRSGKRTWKFSNAALIMTDLPNPAMAGDEQMSNAACAIQALCELGYATAPLEKAARTALAGTALDGRFQVIGHGPFWILDVAHNTAAAAQLAGNLSAHECHGRTHLVLGMLDDKDAIGFVSELKSQVHNWYAVSTHGDRGVAAASLARLIGPVLGEPGARFESAAQACAALAETVVDDDRIVIAGSFSVVGPALDFLRERDTNLDTLSGG